MKYCTNETKSKSTQDGWNWSESALNHGKRGFREEPELTVCTSLRLEAQPNSKWQLQVLNLGPAQNTFSLSFNQFVSFYLETTQTSWVWEGTFFFRRIKGLPTKQGDVTLGLKLTPWILLFFVTHDDWEARVYEPGQGAPTVTPGSGRGELRYIREGVAHRTFIGFGILSLKPP